MGLNHQLDNYAYIRTSSSVMIGIMDCDDPSKGNLYSPDGKQVLLLTFSQRYFWRWFSFPRGGICFLAPCRGKPCAPKNPPWSLCHLPGDLQSLRSAGESRSMRRDPTKIFANLELPFQRQISPRKQPWQPVKKQPKSDHKDLDGFRRYTKWRFGRWFSFTIGAIFRFHVNFQGYNSQNDSLF